MATALRFARPGSGKQPITVEEFMERFHSRELDRVEDDVRRMRESYQAPAQVPDRDAFKNELFAYYAHYHLWFFRVPIDPHRIPNTVWEELQRLYNKDLHAAERDALLNRNAGFIGIIDKITDGLLKQKLESYFDSVFFDYLPSDQQLRLRLAQELLDKYGTVLFPNDQDLKQYYMLAYNIEQVIKTFAMHVHSLGREMRW